MTVKSMVFRSVGAWGCLSVIALVSALGQEPPFEGIVTADKVNVRSGAGDTHYVVTSLSKGDRVRVRKNHYGWYEIVPPENAFSYIAKEDVKLDPPDGNRAATGVVSADRASVRAPSPSGANVGASFKIQLMLTRGTAVTVLGEAGEFYKIAPPEGATLFVHREFVREATEADAPRPAEPQEKPASPQPAPAPAPQPTPSPQPAKPPVPPAVELPQPKPAPPSAADEPDAPEAPPKPESAEALVVQIGDDGSIRIDEETYTLEEYVDRLDEALVEDPNLRVVIRGGRQAEYKHVLAALDRAREAGVKDVSIATIDPVKVDAGEPDATEPATEPAPPARPRLEDVNRRYDDVKNLPLIEQPLSELIVAYEELLTAGELGPTDRGVVEARIRVLEYRRDVQSRLADVQALKQQLDLSREQREEEARRRPKTYTVVGRLQASTLYTGDNLPLLYRISDPSTGLTLAYIQPPSDEDYASIIGQFVGVMGDKEYDPALKLQVVKSSEVDVLRPQQ